MFEYGLFLGIKQFDLWLLYTYTYSYIFMNNLADLVKPVCFIKYYHILYKIQLIFLK